MIRMSPSVVADEKDAKKDPGGRKKDAHNLLPTQQLQTGDNADQDRKNRDSYGKQRCVGGLCQRKAGNEQYLIERYTEYAQHRQAHVIAPLGEHQTTSEALYEIKDDRRQADPKTDQGEAGKGSEDDLADDRERAEKHLNADQGGKRGEIRLFGKRSVHQDRTYRSRRNFAKRTLGVWDSP
jgi:hypothetical protein